MNETEATESWFSRGKAEADKGIPTSERIVGVAIVVFCVLMVFFFIAHQTLSTGFFTATFGTLEIIMLYGSLVFWIITAGLEGILGQRLLSRLFDTFGGLLFAAVATVWLFVVFPFEFTYFADVLPDFLRFLVQWISNDIARVVMVLGTIGYLGAAVYAPIAYGFVGKKRQKLTISEKNMKAIVYTEKGPPAVFQQIEVEIPTPRDDEVLVKILAASVNSWDWELLRKKPSKVILGKRSDPRYKILGCDISGRVETVGKDVKRFKPDDEVFGDLCNSGWGGFAEYVCASENALMLKPASMTFEEAAATPQAGLLALQGLRKYGDIQPGQKVLINGAGGGVGTFAIQIAKHYGADVTGVDSTMKLDMMKSLGADHVIDYTKEDFTKSGLQYDLILDVKVYRSVFDYRRALRSGGSLVVVGGSGGPVFKVIIFGRLMSMFGKKRMGFVIYKPNKDLAQLADLIEARKVVPIIDRRYPLSEVGEAIRHLGDGHVKGKIVITMEHNDEN